MFHLWTFLPTQENNNNKYRDSISKSLNQTAQNARKHGVTHQVSGTPATLAASFVQDNHLLWGQDACGLMLGICCFLWECPTPCCAGIAKHLAHLLSILIYFRWQQQREEEVGRTPFPDLLVAGGPR